MVLKKWIQAAALIVTVASLAGCHSKHKSQDELAINDANSAYSDDNDVQSSGLGEDTTINDQGSSHRRVAANGRVYYFDFDSNVVHDSDKPAIVSNAEKLSSQPRSKVLVTGHTDPRGSREYNIGLGERRAKAVAQILTSNGASKQQIRVVSYGAEKPAAVGNSESDYQLDRRSAIEYLQR
jgi:peptidoglycan-associated lipoprotein